MRQDGAYRRNCTQNRGSVIQQVQQKKTPTAMRWVFSFGAPEGTRTPDLLIRSQALYPAELRAHIAVSATHRIIPIFCGFVNRICKKSQKIFVRQRCRCGRLTFLANRATIYVSSNERRTALFCAVYAYENEFQKDVAGLCGVDGRYGFAVVRLQQQFR